MLLVATILTVQNWIIYNQILKKGQLILQQLITLIFSSWHSYSHIDNV